MNYGIISQVILLLLLLFGHREKQVTSLPNSLSNLSLSPSHVEEEQEEGEQQQEQDLLS